MGRPKSESPNHFKTKKVGDKQYEHTCKHCVHCNKTLGAVRIVATAQIPSTKATEHLAICEGLSEGERRKFAAQLPARGSVHHSFVTHDNTFEDDGSNFGKGLGKRALNEEQGVGEGGAGGVGVGGGGGAGGGNNGPSPLKVGGKMSQYTHSCNADQANQIIFALMQLLAAHALPFTLVESVFFIAFIRLLNSAFVRYLPKADCFRGTWLPRLVIQTKEHICTFFEKNTGRRTLGFDGFKTVVGHVIIVVEVIAKHTVMCEMIDPGTQFEDADFYAVEMERIMRMRAAEMNKPVEEVYCGIVADNVLYNRCVCV